MRAYADRTYINAKLHALYDRLLRRSEYAEIVRSKNINLTLPQVLSELPAEDYLKLKEIVFRYQIAGLLRLVEAASSYERLLRALLPVYQLPNLKLAAARSLNQPVLLTQWNDIAPYQVLERAQLQRVSSPEQLQDLLKDTFFTSIFDDDVATYEATDIRIDVCYLRQLLEQAADLPQGTRRIFLFPVLFRFYFTCLGLKQRLVRDYGYDPDQADRFLEPYALLEPHFRHIAAFVATAPTGLTGPLKVLLKEPAALKDIAPDAFELVWKQCLWRILYKRFHADFHSIWPMIAYFWLLYDQIQNLFLILEAFRFNMETEPILERIVCEA